MVSIALQFFNRDFEMRIFLGSYDMILVDMFSFLGTTSITNNRVEFHNILTELGKIKNLIANTAKIYLPMLANNRIITFAIRATYVSTRH
jgi:hypothetical protein